MKSITITTVGSNFEREPLVRPFGFKGGYMSEIWQSAAMLGSAGGKRGIGLCSQGVLWSDAQVFAGHSESGGNALMYAMSEWAVQQLKGQTFSDPVALLESIRHDVYAYGKNHGARGVARDLCPQRARGRRFRGMATLRGGERDFQFRRSHPGSLPAGARAPAHAGGEHSAHGLRHSDR